MPNRDPRVNPITGDVVRVDGVERTIIYTTVYGKVFYENPAGARKTTDMNTYRHWAENGEVVKTASHPGWKKLEAMISKPALAELDGICAHYARNNGHPTKDLLIEALLEFGIAYALGSTHGREKVYAILKKKRDEKA